MTSKIAKDRNQRILMELVMQRGNDECADCRAHAPRWASWNLGIFICVQCASIHRKIGTHVTKVKSLTLDTWTKEQVDFVKQMGNVKSNAIYNPNIRRNPPPVNLEESERDSEMEKFIRAKYEFKKFMERDGGSSASRDNTLRPSHGDSGGRTSVAELRVREGASVLRSKTAPLPASSAPSPPPAIPAPPKKPVFSSTLQYRSSTTTTNAATTLSNPFPTSVPSHTTPNLPPGSNNPVWNDLISLQMDTSPALQPPLQYASPSLPSTSTLQPTRSVSLGALAFGSNYGTASPFPSTNPFPVAPSPFQSGLSQPQPPMVMSPTGIVPGSSPFAQSQQPFGGLTISPPSTPFQPQAFQTQTQPTAYQTQTITPMFNQPASTSPFAQLSSMPTSNFQSPSPSLQQPFQPVSSFQQHPFQSSSPSFQPIQQSQPFGISQPQMFSGPNQSQMSHGPMQPQAPTGQAAFMQNMMPQRQGTGAGFGAGQGNNPFRQWTG